MRLIAMLMVSSLLTAAVVHADEKRADQLTLRQGGTTSVDLAQKHFDEGMRLFQEHNWDLARFEFQASYDLCKEPDILHNLSIVAEKQEQFADAIGFEERYLAGAAAQMPALERDQTEGRLVRLRRKLAAQSPAVPVVQGPAAPVQNPGAGKPALVATKPYRAPRGALALIGVGAGLLAVGIGTGAGALATQQTVSEGGSYSARDFQSLMDRGQALNACAIGFDTVGGAVLLGGVVWLGIDRARHRER